MADAMLDPERLGLNKWEMHKVLLGLHEPHIHIPETKIADTNNLMTMLQRHRQVYVKPVGMWGGHGITRVIRNRVRTKQNLLRPNPVLHVGDKTSSHSAQTPPSVCTLYVWHEQGSHPVTIDAEYLLEEKFCRVYGTTIGIVQAAAPIRSSGGRPCDIRLLMQRDENDEWIDAGSAVRIGGKGSIVSNVEISQGQVVDLKSFLRGLGLTRSAHQQIRQRLQQAGFAVCRLLEPYRHFNEIGIDFGLAHDNRLWIIEVNTDDTLGAPSHELFAQLKDKRLYQEIEARAAAVKSQTLQFLLQAFFEDGTDDSENPVH